MDFQKILFGMVMMERVKEQLQDPKMGQADVHVKLEYSDDEKAQAKVSMSGTRLMHCFLMASALHSMDSEGQEIVDALTALMNADDGMVNQTSMEFDNKGEFDDAMKREGMGD